MRFMVLRKADADTEAGAMPETEMLEAMGRYMERWRRRACCWAARDCIPARAASG